MGRRVGGERRGKGVEDDIGFLCITVARGTMTNP